MRPVKNSMELLTAPDGYAEVEQSGRVTQRVGSRCCAFRVATRIEESVHGCFGHIYVTKKGCRRAAYSSTKPI